jgi:mannose-1-phosphate guanylyltransferase
VLFAAGRGERLRPLTDRLPKPALPLLDVPLGAFGLNSLAACYAPVAVNLGHQAHTALRMLTPFAPQGTVHFFPEAPEPYGTAGTLAALRDRLDRRVLTFNADVVTDLAPEALLAAHERAGAQATVAVRRVERGADLVAPDGIALERVDRRAEPHRAGHLFLGVAVLERDCLELLDARPPIGLTEGLLRPLVAREEVATFVHDGAWTDVGTPERYLRASLDLLEGRRAARGPEAGATGRRQRAGRGWAWRGPGARGARASLGAGAILLERSRVESGARVERAVVWRGETVPPGTIVRDALWYEGRALDARATAPSGR